MMNNKIYRKILFFLVILCLLFFNFGSALNNEMFKNTDNLRYDLLIISPEIFKEELDLLIYHKEKMGIPTILISLEEIYQDNDLEGRDKAEKVKYKIKEFIDENYIKYVLLVGGKKGQTFQWFLPVRYVFMENDYIEYYEPCFISDLYFADIYDENGDFSSWDNDEDGIYGEWYSGEFAEDCDIDLYPDVAVGRLPCRNINEVRIMVDKIIDYETKTYGQSWFYNMQVFAGDTLPNFPNIDSDIQPIDLSNPDFEGEYYGEKALGFMDDFTPHRYYTSDGTLTFINDVITALSMGSGFAYFVGHGNPQMWGTYPPNGDSFTIGLLVQSVYKIKNENRNPVIILSGCHCCQFDVSIMKLFNKNAREHMENTFECLGWRLTSKNNGGSIATIGCTALGALKEDKISLTGGGNELEVQFFRQYGENNKSIIGEAWSESISWYIDNYPVDWRSYGVSDSWIDAQVVESWILFGDPSLKMGGY